MNIAEINILDCGSTGKIMLQIAPNATAAGLNVYTVSKGWYGRTKRVSLRTSPKHLYVNNLFSSAVHYKLGVLLGLNGLFSLFATFRLICFLKKNNIQLVHLHNLHNFCFNIPLLFYYIKRYRIPVIWTLHDCWSFTGRCPYFDLTLCNKWCSAYLGIVDAQEKMARWVSFYNSERLHSAIGYLTPDEVFAGKMEERLAERRQKMYNATKSCVAYWQSQQVEQTPLLT